MNDCRILFFGRYTWYIPRQKGRLLMFVSRIPGILNETDAKYHVMMYGYPFYSQCIDSQNADFALFKSIMRTNLDIKEAAYLYVVHILQHPTSCPSTKSTQNTMVNVPKKNPSPLPAGKYGKSTQRSTQRCHQANQGKTGLKQTSSEPFERCVACDSKRSLRRANVMKLSS